MAVRSTMAALIAKVRQLINDASGTPVWTDQQVQDELDACREDVRDGALKPQPTYAGLYLDYYASVRYWEDDATFHRSGTSITPTTSEPIVGHWVFSTTQAPPVYIIGKTYDIYRAAANLLESQASQWSLSYSINVDGQTLQRDQVGKALQALASRHRLKQRPTTIRMIRDDLQSNGTSLSLGPRPIDYGSP